MIPPMPELILHHYDMSPFAEKIRLALGVKGLTWRSVQTPMVLPKPDHFELTGGYRRVPVLQVGADIYCDTHLITRVLDRLQPSPPLAPAGLETVELAVSRWAETSFMMVILAFFGIGGIFDEEFVEDRKKTMIPPSLDLNGASTLLSTKLVQLRSNVVRLEAIENFIGMQNPRTISVLGCMNPLQVIIHTCLVHTVHGKHCLKQTRCVWMPRNKMSHETAVRESCAENLARVYALIIHGPLDDGAGEIDFSLG